jgi:hypothetical protein
MLGLELELELVLELELAQRLQQQEQQEQVWERGCAQTPFATRPSHHGGCYCVPGAFLTSLPVNPLWPLTSPPQPMRQIGVFLSLSLRMD